MRARGAETAAAAASDPEPPKRPPGRKNTRDWCRGKEGVPHQPVIVFAPPVFRRPVTITCEWASRWSGEAVIWDCHHEEHCASCGRILRTQARLAGSECPGYPGSETQKAAAVAEAAEAEERWQAGRARRRPVITGPQSYRRKRT